MDLSKVSLVLAVSFASVISINSSNSSISEQVCFAVLGCFPMGEPWHSWLRPIPAPMHPQDINTRIYFYSNQNISRRYVINLHPTINLNGAPFNTELPTAFITHGFASDGNTTWLSNLKDAYLSRVNGNVMLVDWGSGAKLLNYLQVAANTRIVGTELARLVHALNIDPKKLHFIGHSLGSHISSYAAKHINGTARLTALDPAQPGFEGFDATVRLDSTDGDYVDVVHTDARPIIPTFGFGMMYPVGHVDFYMNGGFDQPACIIPDLSKLPKITSLKDFASIPVEIIANIVACPHGRAFEYFTESIASDNCTFWGHKTSFTSVAKTVTNSLTQGFITKLTALSPTCNEFDCAPLGLFTRASPLRGSFVVTTKGRPQFCITEKDAPTSILDNNVISIAGKHLSNLTSIPTTLIPQIFKHFGRKLRIN